MADHLSAVRLSAPAHEELHGAAPPLEKRRRRDRHQPTLVGIEAADLEPHVLGCRRRPQPRRGRWICVDDRLGRDSVRDHDRVLAPVPHPELHVAADRRHGRCQVEGRPLDAIEPVGVVGIPEHDDAVADPTVVQGVGNEPHRPRGMPLLAQDDHVLTGLDCRLDHVLDQARRQTVVPVADLALLTVVDPAAVLGGNPLAPPPQVQATVLDFLLPREVGVATEIEVCRVAHSGKPPAEPLHPDAQATGLAVHIWPFEAEDDEDGADRIEVHGRLPSSRSASACSSRFGAQRSVDRVTRSQRSGPSGAPCSVVATPPASPSSRRLAAMSKTLMGRGAQKTSNPPALVSAIDSAIDPSMRIWRARSSRGRATFSDRGVLSRPSSSMRPRSDRCIGAQGFPPRRAPCLRMAVHCSPVLRFSTSPANASSRVGPSSTASMSPKRGTPCLALRLPSTGSTRTSGKSAPKSRGPASSESTENFSLRSTRAASSPKTTASAARSSSIVVSPPAPTLSGMRPASVPDSGRTAWRTPSPMRAKTWSHSPLVRGPRELTATPL